MNDRQRITDKGDDMDGPWNSGPAWDVRSELDEQTTVDAGDGLATVEMPEADAAVVEAMVAPTQSR